MPLENRFQATLEKYQQQAPHQEKNPYISNPNQLRALQLASKFDDLTNKIYYLNLCKKIHPTIIDQAESFVSDANANNKAALFMWKVKQIKTEWRQNGKDWHHPHPTPTKPKKKTRSQKPKPSSLFDEIEA